MVRFQFPTDFFFQSLRIRSSSVTEELQTFQLKLNQVLPHVIRNLGIVKEDFQNRQQAVRLLPRLCIFTVPAQKFNAARVKLNCG